MSQIVYTLEEFKRIHGRPVVAGESLAANGQTLALLIFESGASIQGGVCCEPPTHRPTKLAVVRHWNQILLDQTTEDFNALKSSLSGNGFFQWQFRRYGASSGNALQDLKWLQEQVLRHRAAIKAIDDEVDTLTNGPAKRAAQAQAAERQREAEVIRYQQQQQLLREVQTVNI